MNYSGLMMMLIGIKVLLSKNKYCLELKRTMECLLSLIKIENLNKIMKMINKNKQQSIMEIIKIFSNQKIQIKKKEKNFINKVN